MQDSREVAAADPECQSPAEVGCPEDTAADPPQILGRVLLLEDDPAFQEVLRIFLAENGYSVVSVKNGGEGVAEVLNGDFALVLCDLNMPGLPGDMFYRAVERIRPDLCARFVFMTGYRGDAKLNEYIKSIGCWVLRKPFPLEDLLALFAFTAERPSLKTICDWQQTPEKPSESPAPEPSPAVQAGAILNYPAAPLSGIRPHVPLATSATPVSWLGDVPVSSSPRRKSSRWLDVSAVLAVVLGFQYLDENNEAAMALADLRAMQAEWAQIEPEFEKASAQRAEAANANAAADKLKRADLRWIATARDIALAINPSIEVLDLSAREIPEVPGACEARIRGVARGEQARRSAEKFRHAIEDSFVTDTDQHVVNVSFERLEEDGSAPEPRAEFTILVGANANTSAVAALKKGDR